MNSRESDRRAAVTLRAAEAGADVARERFRSALEVERKDGKVDVVTQVDRDAQEAVSAELASAFPDEPIVGEEGDARKAVPPSGPAWIVDPIDGTRNYVAGARAFATAVAAVEDGEPTAAAIVCPALSDTYRLVADEAVRNGGPLSVSACVDPEAATVCPTLWWDYDRRDRYAAVTRELVTRFGDVRRFGSAQLELAMVAAGALDGAVTDMSANPWDTVAGVALVRAAGGVVTDLEGDRWRHDSTGLVASNGDLHEDLLASARAIEGR